MYNLFSKWFSKYRIYKIKGGTAFVVVYIHKPKKNGKCYYGIYNPCPDLKNTILTNPKFDMKAFASKSMGFYMGSDIDMTEEMFKNCIYLTLADAQEAIELHKEFVKFKMSYNEVKIIKYV